MGMPISAATPTISKVPTMALAIPPPVSPGGLGNCVKKFQLSELAPLYSRQPRITNSMATVTTVQTPVRVSITLFTNLRHVKSFMGV